MNQKLDDLRRLEADIAVIKDSIRANNGFMRRLLAAPVLGWFFVGFGAACAVVMLMWEYALRQYGGAGAPPTGLVVLLAAVTAAVFAGVSVWKIAVLSRSAKVVDGRYSWYAVIGDLLAHPVLLYQLLIMTVTVFAVVMALRAGSEYLAPAAVALGMATVFMLYAVAFLLNEYSFIIVWLSLFAAAVVVLPAVPPLLMSAIGFGGGFMLHGLYCLSIGRRMTSSTKGTAPGAHGDETA